jgi:aryl-alcohol dehydrogenase-like predicted oxidoreductase
MRNIPGTDLAVHPLCLGANVIGWTADEAESFAVLDAYRAAGGNFVDTADNYAQWVPGNHGGESEEIIGRWMLKRGTRDAIVLATRVGSMRERRLQAAQPTVVSPIASARTPAQLTELMAMTDVELSADELRALDAASA